MERNERFNASGCYDPVSFEVMSKIEREERKAVKSAFLPLVYICCPYRNDPVGNSEKARKFCRFAVDRGYIPLCTILHFPQFMSDTDPEERELALFMDIVLMGKCQEVWVLGDTITEGMSRELHKAERRRQPVRYFNNDFEEAERHA
ncbi:hypothetical protein JT05_00305 [Desulfosporosinus sp. Tol-M]|nr:hypothetical protein JT05_04835 [Desulfosporosinus sp. Tol-M]KGP77227.1 hypothetical protein JT05_00305 [Desulfosporosinus sp. Tol-M]